MYSISSVPLDNPTLDWGVDARTKTLSELTRDVPSVRMPGRDGGVPSFGSTTAPVWALYVRTPVASREALIALVQAGSAVTFGSKSVGYSVASVSAAEDDFAVGTGVVVFALRLDGVFWRDTSTTTSSSASLSSASVAVTGLFVGMSAPVQDALVRVKGAITGLQVTDTAGSWFTFSDPLTGSEWLRFESETGRAFITTSDVWSGGTDVSGLVDFGGPRGVFEITPRLTPGDPTSRDGRLTVATASRSSASIQVRGRGAFVV